MNNNNVLPYIATSCEMTVPPIGYFLFNPLQSNCGQFNDETSQRSYIYDLTENQRSEISVKKPLTPNIEDIRGQCTVEHFEVNPSTEDKNNDMLKLEPRGTEVPNTNDTEVETKLNTDVSHELETRGTEVETKVNTDVSPKLETGGTEVKNSNDNTNNSINAATVDNTADSKESDKNLNNNNIIMSTDSVERYITNNNNNVISIPSQQPMYPPSPYMGERYRDPLENPYFFYYMANIEKPRNNQEVIKIIETPIKVKNNNPDFPIMSIVCSICITALLIAIVMRK